jgi:hypothetical protein
MEAPAPRLHAAGVASDAILEMAIVCKTSVTLSTTSVKKIHLAAN